MNRSASILSLENMSLTPHSVVAPQRMASPPSDWKILEPGRNCWRVAKADRAAVLVDGADYFKHLDAALRSARRSIIIVGWDFDGGIRLRPDLGDENSPPLGPLLRSLVEEHPELEVHILVWSVAVLHAPGAVVPLLIGAEWEYHPRIKLKLDTQHPIYAAHHQKIVCIDDRIAFIGGIDLTVCRWDTHEHAIDDPVRCGSDGTPYHPVHDIQMAVDGDTARALAEIARARWRVATGHELKRAGHAPEIWPEGLSPDFTDVPVAVARTMPPWNGAPLVREAADLTADALSAARHAIYIEAQYLTASYIRDIMVRHLEAAEGPEIVVMLTHKSQGVAERMVMGVNRDRLIHRLKRADKHGRLKILYPCVPTPDGRRKQVLVHAKLVIIDDLFIRVGSSNLNNRSVGLDTECDIAIEARNRAERQTILRIRNGLLAEHLDAEPAEVTRTIEENRGSIVRTIDKLNTKSRGLRNFEAMRENGPTRSAFGTRLLDPKRPFEPLWFLHRKKMRRKP